MRLTRMSLRNYRVFEQPLDLELPPGIVGIYGLNGAGKSTLIEAIRFALYGRARTPIEEIRTSGVNGECAAEVEFEHEGHLYVVRRTITGLGSSVRARAFADGLQVAEGARDTTAYVHSILGMEDAAFRASVFAEQKQLAAFSQQTPAERRKLVLQLLGITPLDAARDRARRDARDAQTQFERLRAVLPDLDQVRGALAEAEAAVSLADVRAAQEEEAAREAAAVLEKARARHHELDVLRQENERLLGEARAARTERDRAAESAARLAAELSELDFATERLERLAPLAAGWREASERLQLVEAVVAAQVALERIPAGQPPAPPDEDGCERARARASEAKAHLAAVTARLEAARAERKRALVAVERSSRLDGEADCPLCGQALGQSFAAVQAHRSAELAAVEGEVLELELDQRRVSSAATALAERALQQSRALKAAQEAWADYRRDAARRADAEQALNAALSRLGRSPREGERAELAAEVERRRQAADECPRLQGRLERRQAAVAELDVERAALADASGRLATLTEKIGALGFSSEALVSARAAVEEARGRSQDAGARASTARAACAEARARAAAEARRLEEAEAQHARLSEIADDSRHLARLAELLSSFRNTLVGTVGPRLSAQAAELFSELTDADYDDLRVDPETYEIRVSDGGRLYGMDRFSGSETDLANLALRVAVSEHVRFQSGGSVGLLVLDEVFGPLDDDRKERMLLALQRLRARFRQVLVITHDAAVKEQLSSAVEVVKMPGRRATARLLQG